MSIDIIKEVLLIVGMLRKYQSSHLNTRNTYIIAIFPSEEIPNVSRFFSQVDTISPRPMDPKIIQDIINRILSLNQSNDKSNISSSSSSSSAAAARPEAWRPTEWSWNPKIESSSSSSSYTFDPLESKISVQSIENHNDNSTLQNEHSKNNQKNQNNQNGNENKDKSDSANSSYVPFFAPEKSSYWGFTDSEDKTKPDDVSPTYEWLNSWKSSIDLNKKLKDDEEETNSLTYKNDSTAKQLAGRNLKVLVVDDAVPIRKITARALEDSGHAADQASDGVEAMEVTL
jgi:CheY-like chemotaxis protein